MRTLVQAALILAIVAVVIAFASNRHHDKVLLTCEWNYDGLGSTAETFTIDYTKSTVNGFPAQITDDVIVWSFGFTKDDPSGTYRSIDRHSGVMSGASAERGAAMGKPIKGTCKPDDRKF